MPTILYFVQPATPDGAPSLYGLLAGAVGSVGDGSGGIRVSRITSEHAVPGGNTGLFERLDPGDGATNLIGRYLPTGEPNYSSTVLYLPFRERAVRRWWASKAGAIRVLQVPGTGLGAFHDTPGGTFITEVMMYIDE